MTAAQLADLLDQQRARLRVALLAAGLTAAAKCLEDVRGERPGAAALRLAAEEAKRELEEQRQAILRITSYEEHGRPLVQLDLLQARAAEARRALHNYTDVLHMLLQTALHSPEQSRSRR